MSMPGRTRTPKWLADSAAWDTFVALFEAHRVGDTLPRFVTDESGEYPLAQRAREVITHVDALTDEQWATLDDLNFPWTGIELTAKPSPVSMPPTTATKQVGPIGNGRDLRRVANGQITLDELHVLCEREHDPRSLYEAWTTRGLNAARHAGISITEALAQPDLVVPFDARGFAIGAWALELRRAMTDSASAPIRSALSARLRGTDYLIVRNLALIERYLREVGDDHVPTELVVELPDGGEYGLGPWVRSQGTQWRAGALDPTVQRALLTVGVDLNEREADRRESRGLIALRQYVRREQRRRVIPGHVEVLPNGKTVYLYNYLSRARTAYRNGTLKPEIAEEITALGIDLDPPRPVREGHFDRNLKLLARYLAQNPRSPVRGRDVVVGPDGKPHHVGLWLRYLRERYRDGLLPQDHIAELERLGIKLDIYSHRERWRDAIAVLREMHANGESVNVSPDHRVTTASGRSFDLYTWIAGQKQRYRKGTLSTAREQELRALGIAVDERVFYDARWERWLPVLDQFIAREGHPNVPGTHVEVFNGTKYQLGQFIATVRKRARRGRVEADRRRDLDARGLTWDVQQDAQDRTLTALRAFVAEHGHAEVPLRYTATGADGRVMHLGKTLSRWRDQLNTGKIPPARAAELAALGVTPERRPEKTFRRGIEAYQHWRAENPGQIAVPPGTVVRDEYGELRLGSWYMNIKNRDRAGTLEPERRAALNAIGWVWSVKDIEFQHLLSVLDGYLATGGDPDIKSNAVVVLDDGSEFPLGTKIETRRRSMRRGVLKPEYEAELRARGVRLERKMQTKPGATARLERSPLERP